jgi:hypothetical protein
MMCQSRARIILGTVQEIHPFLTNFQIVGVQLKSEPYFKEFPFGVYTATSAFPVAVNISELPSRDAVQHPLRFSFSIRDTLEYSYL